MTVCGPDGQEAAGFAGPGPAHLRIYYRRRLLRTQVGEKSTYREPTGAQLVLPGHSAGAQLGKSGGSQGVQDVRDGRWRGAQYGWG